MGWGWAPISWEGWTTTVLVLAPLYWPRERGDTVIEAATVIGVTALLLVLCLMKGTSPGGAKARAEFDRHRQLVP